MERLAEEWQVLKLYRRGSRGCEWPGPEFNGVEEQEEQGSERNESAKKCLARQERFGSERSGTARL